MPLEHDCYLNVLVKNPFIFRDTLEKYTWSMACESKGKLCFSLNLHEMQLTRTRNKKECFSCRSSSSQWFVLFRLVINSLARVGWTQCSSRYSTVHAHISKQRSRSVLHYFCLDNFSGAYPCTMVDVKNQTPSGMLPKTFLCFLISLITFFNVFVHRCLNLSSHL